MCLVLDVRLLFIKNAMVLEMFEIWPHGYAEPVKHQILSGSAAFVL